MFPDLSLYNQELDDRCSLIFSIAACATIILISYSILILILYIITQGLLSAFPGISEHLVTIGIVLYFIFLAITTAPNFLAKKYPHNKKLENFAYRSGKMLNGFFSLYIFEKPLNYMLGILTSNTSSKVFLIFSIFLGFFMGILAGNQSDAYSSYDYMRSTRYFTFNNREHMTIALNYESLRPDKSRIFTPIIPAKHIKSDYLSIFIPTIKREKEHSQLQKIMLLTTITLTMVKLVFY